MAKIPARRVRENTERIRRMLRHHLNALEMQEQTGLPLRTVYAYIQRIKEEDKTELQHMVADGYAYELRSALLSYEEQIRKLIVIRDDLETRPRDKIEAINCIVDIETLMLNLKGYIPKLLEEEMVAKRAAEAIDIEASRYQLIGDATGTGHAPAPEASSGTIVGVYGEGYVEQAPGEPAILGPRRDGGDRSEEEEASETL